MDAAILQKIDEVTAILKQTVEGKCAIALAGAHAKGVADAASDLDIYIFAEKEKPQSVREALIASIADAGTTPWVCASFEETPWGGGMDFMYQGTPVEVVGRTIASMEKSLVRCLAGEFEIIPATWTSNGYYTFIHLCEVHFIKPIWDPDGILAVWQENAKTYPPALRKSILETFLGRANTWLDNFHYDSAIRRGDLLFTAPIVLHTVMDMVQVIFALNSRYYTGDKKLEKALSELPDCPKELLDNLEFLLTASHEPCKLARQREILRSVWSALNQKAKAFFA